MQGEKLRAPQHYSDSSQHILCRAGGDRLKKCGAKQNVNTGSPPSSTLPLLKAGSESLSTFWSVSE